jgi:hypothetical protein
VCLVETNELLTSLSQSGGRLGSHLNKFGRVLLADAG